MATVQLKSRTLSDGRESFYLDIMEGKERKRITLGIYLDGWKRDGYHLFLNTTGKSSCWNRSAFV